MLEIKNKKERKEEGRKK